MKSCRAFSWQPSDSNQTAVILLSLQRVSCCCCWVLATADQRSPQGSALSLFLLSPGNIVADLAVGEGRFTLSLWTSRCHLASNCHRIISRVLHLLYRFKHYRNPNLCSLPLLTVKSPSSPFLSSEASLALTPCLSICMLNSPCNVSLASFVGEQVGCSFLT